MSILPATPLTTLDSSDPGDETQRRFRYQASHAALLSLGLVDPTSEIEEMFCEQHEDTLLRRRDGKYVGVQTKTRDYGRPQYKATDDEIVEAIARFVEQDAEFPGQYVRFVIGTNHSFWAGTKTGGNLEHLIALARQALQNTSGKLHAHLKSYAGKVVRKVRLRSGRLVTDGSVIEVLARIELQQELPKFDDVESRLARHIPEHYDVGDARFDELLRAAKDLISHMFDAGALAHVSARKLYIAVCSNPAAATTDDVIEGKRVTRNTFERVLARSLNSAVLLRQSNPIAIADLPRGMRLLELKMARGAISAANISQARDHKYSAEFLFDRWIHKHTPEKAQEQYEHVSVVVNTECQEAHDIAARNVEPFGTEMLIDVKQRLRTRHADKAERLFGCAYEHLLGVSGILTELCGVWWSHEFAIPTEA